MAQQQDGERQIRSLIEAWANAAKRHDMAGVLAHHTQDIVMFDLPMPLQSKGMAEYRKTWDQFFSSHIPGQTFDIEEITIMAGHDVAFAYAIMRCVPTAAPGGFQFRLTVGLRKVDGAWWVTHEHHSEPAADS
jgi:uncharacterized protein (TIGR02246 family)